MNSSIESPQDPKYPSHSPAKRKGSDLAADQEMVNLGGKSGSGAINSPSSPKLGGKSGDGKNGAA